ncbi:hypothetical protein ACBQ20_08820 [Proteus vulgaris]|uniref:hypothetical protein n=1 Tax=Proteus vulgaris TaxID=585 RepID=UPI0035259865
MSELKVYNLQLLTLLDEKEAFSIAKSIAKWTHSKFTEESFEDYVIRTHTSEIQSIRGKKGGGKSRSGRPKGSIDLYSVNQIKPWVNIGVSRSHIIERDLINDRSNKRRNFN